MQVTAGSPKRTGQAKAGAAVRRLPQTGRGPPPRPEPVRGCRRDGRRSPGLCNAEGQASVPSRDSPVHKPGLTPKSCGLTRQRLGLRPAPDIPEQETAREPGPGTSEGKAGTDTQGPQGSRPTSPSHGELDHGESGARAAQLRLEIWVAPDRLHSHHS